MTAGTINERITVRASHVQANVTLGATQAPARDDLRARCQAKRGRAQSLGEAATAARRSDSSWSSKLVPSERLAGVDQDAWLGRKRASRLVERPCGLIVVAATSGAWTGRPRADGSDSAGVFGTELAAGC